MDRSQSPIGLLVHHRPFLIYWMAGLSANFGWQIQLVAASWLMTAMDGRPELVALVQASVALPVMLLSLPGGAISDAIGDRKIVLWAQTLLLAVSVALALLSYIERLTPALLLACTFMVGCGRALYYPGWQAMVFEFIEKKHAVKAVALSSSNLNIARSLGPAIGGSIVAIAGGFAAFSTSALTNVSVLLFVLRWKGGKRDTALPPEPLASAMIAGIRYVSLSPLLVTIMFRSLIFNIAAIAVLALMPLVARDLLEGGPTSYGVLLGAFGFGAVSGALLIDMIRSRFSLEPFLAAGFLGFAISSIGLAWSPLTLVSMLASALGGLSWVFVQVTLYSLTQISSPRWVLSRAIAIFQMAVFGGNAAGSFLWGRLASEYGTSASLAASAVFLILGSGLALVFKIRPLEPDKLDSNNQWSAPQPKLDMVMTSGPVITTITYRILDRDVEQFLEAMGRKRRNRIRDGASRWALSRDMQDPCVWFERFYVATWAEAQRLHARRTMESAELIDYLRSLHQGSERPEVHYELIREPSRGERQAKPISLGP
ncbi:MFS transporter [Rhizobium sp. BK456]|uniref:MFS transporter n=1 Tax=Rhizobium sp. BK456 TaxID=2587007 RepID=UPI00161E821C|nr:MFS transporter [Rhizobium sp. BK456]MBB3527016.1 MFS family permease [Rhizobium sp. BK456]